MTPLISANTLVAQRFLVEQLAGSGGMGSVYRVRDLHSGNPVALKVLHVAKPSIDEIERFSREARLLASLDHPGSCATSRMARQKMASDFWRWSG